MEIIKSRFLIEKKAKGDEKNCKKTRGEGKMR